MENCIYSSLLWYPMKNESNLNIQITPEGWDAILQNDGCRNGMEGC